MAGSMVYRLEVGPPDSAEMVSFRTAMQALQGRLDNQSFNFIAGYHGAPSWYCWHQQFSKRSPVQARLFLPWHRAYLWTLEQALQDQVSGVSLPWWDWTTTPAIPAAYDADSLGGKPNPLNHYRISVPATKKRLAIDHDTTRNPGAQPGIKLPTGSQIDQLLRQSDWPSFSDGLESYHDSVHGWVGGDMGDQTTAAYDPIFYAHHCMIDRIWSLWQVRWGINRIQQDLLDMPLQPFNKVVRDTLDVQALGYEYAATSASIDTGGGAAQ